MQMVLSWEQKVERLKAAAMEVGARFWVEEFADGNKRARVDLRNAERKLIKKG
jgi:hypothetical protein